MVERPIKKSERQAIANASTAAGETLDSEPRAVNGDAEPSSAPKPRSIPRPSRLKDDQGSESRGRDDKGKGKGKGRSRDNDEPVRPASLATMRGPRPVQAPEPVVEEVLPETTEELVEEVPSEATAEASDTSTEETVDAAPAEATTSEEP